MKTRPLLLDLSRSTLLENVVLYAAPCAFCAVPAGVPCYVPEGMRTLNDPAPSHNDRIAAAWDAINTPPQPSLHP